MVYYEHWKNLWSDCKHGIFVDPHSRLYKSDSKYKIYLVTDYKGRPLCNLIFNSNDYTTEIQRTYYNKRGKLMKYRISKQYMNLIKMFIIGEFSDPQRDNFIY